MNPRGLNFIDGVLWIDRSQSRFEPGHKPSDVFTYCLPFNYMGERKESLVWKPFIEQVIPDSEYRRYVLASMVNAIAGDPMSAQRMLLLMGVGASGKSTLIDAISSTVGSDNVCRVDDLKNLTKDESRYRIDLANNILCICGDASGNIGNKDVLKQIVSKEEVSGRRLYREVEYFIPRASLIVASNEIGFTHALGDSGIERRIDIIEFRDPIDERSRDPLIGEKLREPNEQREMILDMIDCIQEMQSKYGKFVRPDRMVQSMKDLRYDGDNVLAFFGHAGLDVCKEEEPDTEWIHQTNLLKAYNYFCGMNGNSMISMRGLKGKLATHGLVKKGARGSTHMYLFKVNDQELKNKAFLI
jgi:P4 family phage/plasmid primase-like protien